MKRMGKVKEFFICLALIPVLIFVKTYDLVLDIKEWVRYKIHG